MDMMMDKRKAEKEVWDVLKPFLNLPPTSENSKHTPEGMRQYIKARRIISESVKDPLFVKRVQERKATFRELLMQDFGSDTFAKLFDSDMRACVPNKKR
jgi:hypothetical protein